MNYILYCCPADNCETYLLFRSLPSLVSNFGPAATKEFAFLFDRSDPVRKI